MLADLAVAPGDWPAPPVSPAQQLDWPDTLRIIARLRDLLSGPEPAARPMRLLHALFVADMLGRASFQKVRGARLDELLDTLIQAAPQETPSTLEDVSAPTTLGKTQFRLVVAQYASRDTLAATGWAYHLRKMFAGLRRRAARPDSRAAAIAAGRAVHGPGRPLRSPRRRD